MFDDIDVGRVIERRKTEQATKAIRGYYDTFVQNYAAGDMRSDEDDRVRVLIYSLRHKTKAIETPTYPAGTSNGYKDYVPDPARYEPRLAGRLFSLGITLFRIVREADYNCKYDRYYAVCNHVPLSACRGKLREVYVSERDRMIREARDHLMRADPVFTIRASPVTVDVLRELEEQLRPRCSRVTVIGDTLRAYLH